MLYFSASAYCDANRVQAWSCIPCSHPALDGFNVTHYLSDSAMDVAGYVGIDAHGSADPAIRTVVVAFRGTVPSLRDWVENLDFAKAKPYATTCPDCAVHAGFLAAYEGLEHQVGVALCVVLPLHYGLTHHIRPLNSDACRFEATAAYSHSHHRALAWCCSCDAGLLLPHVARLPCGFRCHLWAATCWQRCLCRAVRPAGFCQGRDFGPHCALP